MPVLTKAQSKRLALRSIRRLERDIQSGIRRVSRAWRRLRGRLAEAVLDGDPILDRVQKAFSAQTATLAGAMRLAYLQGVQHVLTVAGPHLPAQLALYDSAVANMEARLGMDAAGRAALALQTSEKAAKVLTLTGTALETSLRETLITIQQRELTLGAAKKEMRRAIANTGLGPEKNYQLEAIFRTQTQISYNAGRWDALQDEAIQDVLWGYEYATVGDDRVRDSHAELGEPSPVRAPKDDPIWTAIWPPNGWNCRCTTIEIFEPEPVKAAPEGWTPDKGFTFDPRGTYTVPGKVAVTPPVKPIRPKAKPPVKPEIKWDKLSEQELDAEVWKQFKVIPQEYDPVLRPIAETMDDMSRRFPKYEKHLAKTGKVQSLRLEMVDAPGGEKYFAGKFSPATRRLEIQRTLSTASDPLTTGKWATSQVTRGSSLKSTMRHELGHEFHEHLSASKWKQWEAAFRKTSYEDIQSVSGYATVNAKEGFAESFTAYMHPKYERGMLPKRLEDMMDILVGG